MIYRVHLWYIHLWCVYYLLLFQLHGVLWTVLRRPEDGDFTTNLKYDITDTV